MNTFDFSPLYRSTVGFDHLAGLFDAASRLESKSNSYPPYNIEVLSEDSYRITMAVAGFSENDIDVVSENNLLTVSGSQQANEETQYLYQGIAARNFERKFKLADHVKVLNAHIENGLLQVDLKREIPEAMKPKKITVTRGFLQTAQKH